MRVLEMAFLLPFPTYQFDFVLCWYAAERQSLAVSWDMGGSI